VKKLVFTCDCEGQVKIFVISCRTFSRVCKRLSCRWRKDSVSQCSNETRTHRHVLFKSAVNVDVNASNSLDLISGRSSSLNREMWSYEY